MSPAALIAAFMSIVGLLDTASPEAIGSALGTSFSMASDEAYIEVWTAPGAAPVTSWELRVPKPEAVPGGFIIAEIAAPGIAEADLAPALDKLEMTSMDVVSPPLEGGGTWVPMHSSCYAMGSAQFCVSWEGLDSARAVSMSLDAAPSAE